MKNMFVDKQLRMFCGHYQRWLVSEYSRSSIARRIQEVIKAKGGHKIQVYIEINSLFY